jgi:cyclopropane fatty-acyl-phospholipid synthase-like methyltransferase
MDDRKPQVDRSVFYRHYSEHKQWIERELTDDIDRFSRTMGKLRLSPKASILEIGFGEGRFLDWARSKGHHVEGIEIIPEMVDRARKRDHVVHLGRIRQAISDGRRFDLIAAFDVIEHFSVAEILDFLEDAEYVLNPGGRLVLQFPNAGSPFSAPYQIGDVTHQTALSEAALNQISQTKGWVVTNSFNARVTHKPWLKRLKWGVAHLIRDAIEIVCAFAYYGWRYPFDPNVVAVLERSKAATGQE